MLELSDIGSAYEIKAHNHHSNDIFRLQWIPLQAQETTVDHSSLAIDPTTVLACFVTIEKAAQKQADQGILKCQQTFPNTRQAFEWTPTFHISKAAVKALLPLLGNNCDVSISTDAAGIPLMPHLKSSTTRRKTTCLAYGVLFLVNQMRNVLSF